MRLTYNTPRYRHTRFTASLSAILLAFTLTAPLGARAETTPHSADEIAHRVLQERQGEPYHISARLYALGVSPRNLEGRSSAPIPLEIFNLWQPERVQTLYRIAPPERPVIDFLVDHDLILDRWNAFVRASDGEFLKIGEEHLATRFADLDFTFEDLAFTFLLWPTHSLDRISKSKGRPCYVIESFPGSDYKSQYSSVRSWIDQEGWFPLRLECHAKDNPDQVFRQIEIISVKKEGDHWNLSKIEARDLIRRTRTRMEVLEVRTGPDAVPEDLPSIPDPLQRQASPTNEADELPPLPDSL